MARLQMRLGDMFDGPSDLIVLPCSTSGTISPFVSRKAPCPSPDSVSGRRDGTRDVKVFPFEGGENIVQLVAYAASVEYNSPSDNAISRIGEHLGAIARQLGIG